MTTLAQARAWSVATFGFSSANGTAHGAARRDDGPKTTVSWSSLSLKTRIYVGAVIAAGAIAISLAVPHALDLDLSMFAMLAALSLVASLAKVNLPVPRSCSTLTICYVLDFTTLLVLGPAAATLTAGLSAWSQCTFRPRQPAPAFQTWFSVGALALTLQAAGLMYAWLGGRPADVAAPLEIEALVGASTVFFLVNTCLVAAAIGLSTGQSIARVWTTNYMWSWPGHLLGFSVAIVAAMGFGRSGLWLIPIALISLGLTYENFRAYVTRLTDSVTDPLTGLPNMRHLLSHTAQELSRSHRDHTKLAVLLIDLDGFKAINDTYGHRTGDAALQEVARTLQESIRFYDTCARYGGDEFVAVLPGCSLEDAERKSQALQAAVRSLRFAPNAGAAPMPLRISVGVAVFPDDGETVEDLISAADARMFEDKDSHHERRAESRPRSPAPAVDTPPLQAAVGTDREEKLLEAQRMEAMGQLTGGIAHDFNNVLTAIIGYSDLLSEQITSDQPMSRDLKEIMDAAHHAASLTHQLLAFSRKQDVTTTNVNLNEVVRASETMLRRVIGERITIVTELAHDLHPVVANATQLEQVVVNLSVNARDAMPFGGTLTIQTRNVELGGPEAAEAHPDRKPGRYIELRVSDSGIGMTPEIQARIFDMFFTTKEPGRGTGLGLASVHRIIANADGHITVKSQPGRGSSFHIYLPESPAAADGLRPPMPGLGTPALVGGETILLVEDEDAVRQFATIALKRHGYKVLEARNAEDALFLLGRLSAPIHLLLTDVVLPGMDGCELATRFERGRPRTPVLFTTGYADGLKSAERLLDKPDVQLLEKPFSARALLEKTRELLDTHAA